MLGSDGNGMGDSDDTTGRRQHHHGDRYCDDDRDGDGLSHVDGDAGSTVILMNNR